MLNKFKFNELFLERNKFRNSSITETEYDYRYFNDVICKYILLFKISLRELEKIIIELYLIIKANIKKVLAKTIGGKNIARVRKIVQREI